MWVPSPPGSSSPPSPHTDTPPGTPTWHAAARELFPEEPGALRPFPRVEGRGEEEMGLLSKQLHPSDRRQLLRHKLSRETTQLLAEGRQPGSEPLLGENSPDPYHTLQSAVQSLVLVYQQPLILKKRGPRVASPHGRPALPSPPRHSSEQRQMAGSSAAAAAPRHATRHQAGLGRARGELPTGALPGASAPRRDQPPNRRTPAAPGHGRGTAGWGWFVPPPAGRAIPERVCIAEACLGVTEESETFVQAYNHP